MKKETLEEAVKKYYEDNIDESNIPREHYELEIQDLMIGFAYKWQQEKDNKELAMWKLAVEKQEARCTTLRAVISDLKDKNKYSEEDLENAFLMVGYMLKI